MINSILTDLARAQSRQSLEDKMWNELHRRLALAGGEDLEEEREWSHDQLNAKPSIALKDYARQAWHVLEPGREMLWNWHLDQVFGHLEAVSLGDMTRLVINIPPGTMKSLSVCVMWHTWEWTWAPWSRWLFYSYNQAFSIRDAVKARRLIRSSWYQRRWGHVFQMTKDQDEKTRYENDKTGFRLVSGFGGSVTGERGDRIVIDDPLKADEAHNDNARASVNDTYDQAISSRLSDPVRSAIVLIMQRLAQDDLAGHVLDKEAGWNHLVFPMEYEPPREDDLDHVPPSLRNWSSTSLGAKDPRTKPGALLWKQRFPPEVIVTQKEDLGSYGYAAQNQQRPTPAEGGIFKRDWWVFWEPSNESWGPVTIKMPDGSHIPAQVIKLPLHFDMEAQSWDLSFKDTKKSAFNVGQAWGSKDARAFLLNQVRGKMDFLKVVQTMLQFSKQHPDGPKWVEDKANGPAVISTLKDKVDGIIAVNPQGDKPVRAWAQQPYVQAGNVILPHPSRFPWVWDFIEECAAAPFGTYMDQVDTFTQALKEIRRWRKARGSGKKYMRHVA